MEMFYFKEEDFPAVANPQIGRYYAVKFESEWHRVEVVDVKGVFITCFFLDNGDREVVTIDNLKELDAVFLQLAPQAFSVRLMGLEHLEEDPR